MSETIVFTSGKGGVGKTTTIANIGVILSQLDKKVIMLDTDMGLRNLDVVMGLEDQINYNLLDLLENRCRIHQAIIKDKRYPNLYIIPASLKVIPLAKHKLNFQTLVENLKLEFDYILIDCPAGIEQGFQFAISVADRAVIVTTPHISALKDASRVLCLLEKANIKRIELIINNYNKFMVQKNSMLSIKDIQELFPIPILGTIPTDQKVLISQDKGIPVVSIRSKASKYFFHLSKHMTNDYSKVIGEDVAYDISK